MPVASTSLIGTRPPAAVPLKEGWNRGRSKKVRPVRRSCYVNGNTPPTPLVPEAMPARSIRSPKRSSTPATVEAANPVTTEYTYTWHTDSNQDEIFQAKTITTKLPNVAATQNGVAHPQNDTIVNEYNLRGQLIKSTDARGMLTEYDYDQATGATIQMIRDSGAGKLNLTTDYEVDNRGRVTRTLGPVHDVDGTDVRTASWTVHVDEHETWRGQGYHNPGTSTDTLVNPVQIERRSADGTTVDRITATRGSTVESSGAMADTDTLSEDVAWTRQIYDIFGRMTASRVYHAIPTSGSGSAEPTIPKRATVTMLWIDRTWLNRLTARSIARFTTFVRWLLAPGSAPMTQGATDSDPTGGGGAGNNMVQLRPSNTMATPTARTGLRTKLTTGRINATSTDDRVTEFAYDSRDRLTNTITTDGTDEFQQKPTLDNLGRTTKQVKVRNDSRTLKLIAQSEQFFDDRGRPFRSKTYAVSNTGVAGNDLNLTSGSTLMARRSSPSHPVRPPSPKRFTMLRGGQRRSIQPTTLEWHPRSRQCQL